VEQLSQALAKKDDATDADDAVKSDNAEPPKEAPEKEQTDAEAIADPATSVAHLAEIVRANNAKEKEAEAELARIHQEEERKKAEEARKKKEAEALEAKLKDEKEVQANEALGEQGLQYLQNMAQTRDKEVMAQLEKQAAELKETKARYEKEIMTFEELKKKNRAEFERRKAERKAAEKELQLRKQQEEKAEAEKKAAEKEVKPASANQTKTAPAPAPEAKPAQATATAPVVANATATAAPVAVNASAATNATATAPAAPARKDPMTAPRLETLQKNSTAVKVEATKPEAPKKLAVTEPAKKAKETNQTVAAPAPAKPSSLAAVTTQNQKATKQEEDAEAKKLKAAVEQYEVIKARKE